MLAKLARIKAAERKTLRQQRKAAAGRIITVLLDAGITQKTLADELGITQPVISNNWRGITTASATTIACLVHLARQREIEIPEDIQWRPVA